MRRLLCILLSLMTFIFAGCSKAAPKIEKSRDELRGNLVIWTNKENSGVIKAAYTNYKKLHESVTLNLVEINEEELNKKLAQKVNSEIILPDIISIEDEEVRSLLNEHKELFEEISTIIKKDNYPNYKIENITSGNKLYCIPFTAEPALMLYRSDLTNAANINLYNIKTWRDFIEASKTVAKTTGKKMLSLPKENEKSYSLWINQLGGAYTDGEDKLALNSDEKIKAAELLKAIYMDNAIQNRNSSKSTKDYIREGAAAAFIVSPKEINGIYKDLASLKEKFKIMKLPAFEEGGNEAATIGGQNLMILKDSKNKKLALDFCRFTAENRENLKMLMTDFGINPAYMGFYDEKWFGENNWRLYSRLIKETYPFKYSEEYEKLKPQIEDSLYRITVKNEDVKAVLDELQLKNLLIPES